MSDERKTEESSGEVREDPNEVVGPEECGASIQDCELKPGERDGAPQESQFTTMNEIEDAFPVEQIPVVLDEDGLARPVDVGDMSDAFAQPFTYETVICIEDDRQYEELFDGEYCQDNADYRAKEMNTRPRYKNDGEENVRKLFNRESVKFMFGQSVVMSGLGLIPVRPVRPVCRYYKRQCFAHDGIAPGEPGHRIVFRNCMMRRSIGGAFLSLNGEAIYACDYRDPPDRDSIREHLDQFDSGKLSDRPDLVHIPFLGGEGADIHYDEEGNVK